MAHNLNLKLHCGGSVATREQIAAIPTPPPVDNKRGGFVPIPHMALIETIETQLNALDMRIVNEAYGVANNGNRMFGVLQIANGKNSPDYSWVAGIRNTHDKKFPAGLCVGSGVFVCDNLAFSSEITFGRRHTKHILDDLPLLATTAVGRLSEKWNVQNKRLSVYKETDLSRMQASDILIRAMEEEIFPKTHIDSIWAEWKAPRHQAFKDRNVWSFFNCVTEHLKPRAGSAGHSLWDLPVRTTRLHAICDAACGVEFEKFNATTALREVEVDMVEAEAVALN